ncbi:MAG: hypothetical protein AAF911_05250 [Planctomycetota bacterium]
MRKQYHLRESPRGLLAWDIDRLIDLSRSRPVQKIALSDIREFDEPFWFNQEDLRPTVRDVAEHAKLIRDCDLQYPIILDHTGRVMDGMHRVAKAWLEGAETVNAVRFTFPLEPDHVGVAAKDLSYDRD